MVLEHCTYDRHYNYHQIVPYHIYGIWFFKDKIQGQRCYIPCFACGNELLNTMWAIIISSCVDVYFVFLLRQAFISIPESISEAAKIDGCNHFTIYARIITPLAKPSIATMILFSFVWTWNDYMSPYLYISDINKQMLSVGIKLFSAGQVQDYGSQMAAATLVLLPIIVVFLFCQRFFIENATSSGVKG